MWGTRGSLVRSKPTVENHLASSPFRSSRDMVEISTILWDVGGVLLTNGWDHRERAAVLKKFQLDTDSFEQRHELANDPWEKGLITAEESPQRTVFYEPRSFTPAEFLQAMKERSTLLP